MEIQKYKVNSKIILIVSLAAILLLGSGFVYALLFTDTFTDGEISSVDDSNIGFSPPTEQEIKDSQSAKERILNEGQSENNSETNDSSQTNKTSVTVGISYAGIINEQLEIRAFSPSIISGSGTCTATVSKSGSLPITKATPAFIDASSTICEPIYIPKSDLTTGTWDVNVTYISPTHEGSSGQISVEVN